MIRGGIRPGKFVIHPNGRRIDFLARETQAEVWVLENFLPKEGR